MVQAALGCRRISETQEGARRSTTVLVALLVRRMELNPCFLLFVRGKRIR